jgi:hypothetical protein
VALLMNFFWTTRFLRTNARLRFCSFMEHLSRIMVSCTSYALFHVLVLKESRSPPWMLNLIAREMGSSVRTLVQEGIILRS